MAITEQSRYQLYKRLEEMLGADDANTLMEHLPPVGWSDVAMRTDIDHLHAATQADLAEVRATTQAGLAELGAATQAGLADVRADIALLRTETRTDIDQLRTETRTDIDQLRTETKADFALVRSDMRQLEERLTMHVDKALAVGLHRQFVQLIASTAAMFAIWSTIIVLIGR